MASNDFMPHARGPYREFLVNLHDRIPTTGVTLGLAAGDITAVGDACTAQIGLIDALIAAETALQGAQEAQKTGRETTDELIREWFGDWKRLSAWTDEIAAQLMAVGSAGDFDPNTYKVEFKVRIVAGEIRIDWKKKQTTGVAVYARLAGTTPWIWLSNDTSSPYIDGRPLANPTVPETREYMLRGMLKDEEIGLDSDILSITWAG